MKSKKKPIPVHTLILHTGVHPDEAYAAWLLQSFGHQLFPGIDNVEWIFIDAGSDTYDGKTGAELLAEGYLMLGVGHDLFDEHDRFDNKDCAATLVAKYLGIDDRPALEKMLNYVRANDRQGQGATTDLASRMRRLYRNGAEDLDVITMAYEEFEADWDDRSEHYVEAHLYYKNKDERWINLPGGKRLKIAWLVSDNEMVSAVARSKHGDQVAILVQEKTNGQVFVYPVPRYGLDLRFIAGGLRAAEASYRGIPLLNDAALYLPGKHPEVPQWFYFRNDDGKDISLMNGSLTAPNVDPTCLRLETIVDLVMHGLQLAHNPDQVARLNHLLSLAA